MPAAKKEKKLYRVWSDVPYRTHVLATSPEHAEKIANDSDFDGEWECCMEQTNIGEGGVRDATEVESEDED